MKGNERTEGLFHSHQMMIMSLAYQHEEASIFVTAMFSSQSKIQVNSNSHKPYKK